MQKDLEHSNKAFLELFLATTSKDKPHNKLVVYALPELVPSLKIPTCQGRGQGTILKQTWSMRTERCEQCLEVFKPELNELFWDTERLVIGNVRL